MTWKVLSIQPLESSSSTNSEVSTKYILSCVRREWSRTTVSIALIVPIVRSFYSMVRQSQRPAAYLQCSGDVITMYPASG